MKKYLLLTIWYISILSSISAPVVAQRNPSEISSKKEVRQIQPVIMVIPFAKEHEDLRTMLDSSVTQRVAIIKVQEAFDNRGFTTVDFRAKLNATKTDAAYKMMNQSDFKSRIAEGSGADIYVEVEADMHRGSGGNSARLNLIAFDAFTGRLLGSKTISSKLNESEQFDRLIENALKRTEMGETTLILDNFLNVMQQKFDDIVENGRAIKVIFGLAPTSEYDYYSEVGTNGDQIADVIDDWFEENAYKGVYHQQSKNKKEIIYDEVRIPLRDERDRNFTPSKYARQIRSFCHTLSLTDSSSQPIRVEDDTRGGTIYITIK